ncbi:hypothetical protein K493DRAFT_319264 [Basidiobolus meristosporus CBS 931.73]|uniref:Extracellular membrane protein CFEM domain-containing protein n=1 Tax=Basidiobolus meristosporus CBS 931.73 TaxID=1314790 RepID=A0A1Y1XSI3_9FUNG|nr:hypothetical protein K493DRAFT_319264 [Basidiobolus meristosporus CBS 931.73]|eukprot:ORX88719.1 hypothetical protein K493DRAFT_319264 [Basidiobolus meristosporus CBS 931.73]
MHASRRFLLISALVATAMADTPASVNATEVDPRVQCMQERSCGSDVNCIARCFNVPSPDDQAIGETLKCVADCKSDDIVAVINCRQLCVGEHFQPTGTPNTTPTETSTSQTGNPTQSQSPSGTQSSTTPNPTNTNDASADSNSGASAPTVFSVISLAAAFAALSVLL